MEDEAAVAATISIPVPALATEVPPTDVSYLHCSDSSAVHEMRCSWCLAAWTKLPRLDHGKQNVVVS